MNVDMIIKQTFKHPINATQIVAINVLKLNCDLTKKKKKLHSKLFINDRSEVSRQVINHFFFII